jgi:hypothetical protein
MLVSSARCNVTSLAALLSASAWRESLNGVPDPLASERSLQMSENGVTGQIGKKKCVVM